MPKKLRGKETREGEMREGLLEGGGKGEGRGKGLACKQSITKYIPRYKEKQKVNCVQMSYAKYQYVFI